MAIALCCTDDEHIDWQSPWQYWLSSQFDTQEEHMKITQIHIYLEHPK
jgi:hypothetical protein